MRGWADEDGDGKVTAGEAVAYTQRAIKITSRRNQTPQFEGPEEVVLASPASETGPSLPDIVTFYDHPPNKEPGGSAGAGGGRTTLTPQEPTGVCPASACAGSSPFEGTWLCSLGGGTQVSIDAGRVFIRPRQGVGGAGCMTCDGSFETTSDDGRYSSTNGRFMVNQVNQNVASVDWQSCVGDLETCRRSEQRRQTGPFACQRVRASGGVATAPPPAYVQGSGWQVVAAPPPQTVVVVPELRYRQDPRSADLPPQPLVRTAPAARPSPPAPPFRTTRTPPQAPIVGTPRPLPMVRTAPPQQVRPMPYPRQRPTPPANRGASVPVRRPPSPR